MTTLCHRKDWAYVDALMMEGETFAEAQDQLHAWISDGSMKWVKPFLEKNWYSP